jgi:PadR family transcriptional regulator PadR
MLYNPSMPQESIEQKKAQMRKSLVEFCILLVIRDGRAYSSDILKTLTEANLLVVEGTLYPLLSRLKTQELVEYEWEESKSGPPRKYYKLTKSGQDTLAHLEKTWDELRISITALTNN